MNRHWFQLWNLARLRSRFLDMLALGRTLLLLSAGSLLFFVLLGAGGAAGHKLNPSPLPSMQGLAASLSGGFFKEMLGMEVAHLPKAKEGSALSGNKVTAFVLEMLTSINPSDPKSLIAREVPGLAADDPVLLRRGSGGAGGAPADYHPGTGGQAAPDPAPSTDPAPSPDPAAAASSPGPSGQPAESAAPDSQGQGGAGSSGEGDPAVKRVLIYHSHARESYNPLLGTASDNPSSADPDRNVMLVGSYVASVLEKRGIGTLHSTQDYASTMPDYNWNFSYKYSRMTVKSAMAANGELDEMIDIHRDSQRHDKTTTVIGGQSYAQIYFILGHENKDWKKNEAFANAIHQRLEKQYPGISRGIWGKTSAQGNGEYNQSLSPNSVLIEIGGVDSTKEELKRTADALGEAIADVYWSGHEAQKADAPAN
ncbi:stage II sporulation protein P [Paenibacillus glufosinatiresistens]|uniref:stage II sporulation protein P n=1 Tax=Paenibacillus glufosinatiresistens TaxID=3070657 RepID=UPI00286DB6C7|nr:stage II sporulation protein P [Paenibacillus sp. YX.27]